MKKKPNKKSKLLNSSRLQLAIGLALVLIGLGYIGLNLHKTTVAERSATKPQPVAKVLKNNQPAKTDQPPLSGTPIWISVPSVAIDVKVIPGYYYPADHSWTLTPTTAQWGTMTAKANNQAGDTFIYAHDLKNLFYNLPKVTPGAEAIVTTDNGHTFTYKFASSTITSPQDTRLFSYQGSPILILQTCTGAWYQDRQLFVFNLSGAS